MATKTVKKLATAKVYQKKVQSTLIGRFDELFGDDDDISIIPSNYDSDSAIMFVIDYADGTSDTIVCTHELSKLVRSKQISMANLYTLDVFDFVGEDGNAINMLQLPQDESKKKQSIKGKDVKAKALPTLAPASVKTLQDRISLV
jgi:hypothetical protein